MAERLQKRRGTDEIVGLVEESILRTTLKEMAREEIEEEAELEAAVAEAKKQKQKLRHKENQDDFENQKAIKDCLNKFDTEPGNFDSGGITYQDLYELLSNLVDGANPQMCAEWLQEFDRDGNGLIDMQEFCELLLTKLIKIDDTQAEISQAFKLFDKEDTGFLTASEAQRVMCILGNALDDEEFQAFMKKSDVDSNGEVNYETLIKTMFSNLFDEEGKIPAPPKN